MIDGLKLTVTGNELRALLDQRIEDHLRCAERWKGEQMRTSDQQPKTNPSCRIGFVRTKRSGTSGERMS